MEIAPALSNLFYKIRDSVDWVLFGAVLLISLGGLVTMNSFIGDSAFFQRQSILILISILALFATSNIEWRFLRKTNAAIIIFLISIASLLFLFIYGEVFNGARSWFDFGIISFQPVDFSKLALILVLSKYFSRRHIEIANVRHILVSGAYALSVFVLVFLQPDFGSAIIIFLIWLGMVLMSGISRKHLLFVFILGISSFLILWSFVFKDYQKQRIVTFLNPLTDVRGAGYNAYQSTIAVGSGEILGKGIGLGSQSKLRFLPEYQTDFIFAAFAEEWGFIGAVILFGLYGLVIWKILTISHKGETNFEILYGVGLSCIFMSHFIIHVGMNIGLLPVTGTILPFMSYGGSHLLMEFVGLGILMGMKNYSRVIHKDTEKNELIQID